MKKIVTPSEMQDIDRKAIQSYGIPGETLMENAGKSVFDYITAAYPGYREMRIAVFCGKGNNGGDGLVIARYLHESGIKPEVYVFGRIPDLKQEALLNFNRLIATGLPVQFINEADPGLPADPPDLIIDAILGTGTKGDLDGVILSAVEVMNHWKSAGRTQIISVDIPSGLNGETGYPGNAAVEADSTVTFGLPKQGLIFGDGKQYTGELYVADIGFPEKLTSGGDRLLVEPDDVGALFKPRRTDDYKYRFGKVLVIAGSRGMSGAAFLTAKAVLRAGAGMLKVALPECIAHVIENQLPEALTAPMPQTDAGSLGLSAMDALRKQMEWCDVVAVGPGLSRHEETTQLVCNVIRDISRPAVIDADAIVALAGCSDWLRNSDTPMVFTPHAGEFAHLADVSVSAIKENRMFHLTQTVKKLRKTVLLKGSPTLIAGPGTPVWVSNTGNPGMATAGCGDVLTGIIAAFIAQGLSCDEAAYAGAWIHGYAGNLAAEELSQISLIASDLIDALPEAFNTVLR